MTRVMQTSEIKPKRQKRPARSHAADAFVVLAMTLTTVALAIGLYFQFRLAFWLAVVAALSVYVGLLALHALVRRSERVERLTAEIARLESELQQKQHGSEGRAEHQMPPAHMQGPGPGYGPGTMAAPAAASAPPRAPVAAAGHPGAGPGIGPGMGAAPQVQNVTVAQQTAGQHPAAAPPPLSAPVAAMPGRTSAEQGVPERAVDAIMNDYWAFRPAQPPRLPEPVAHEPLKQAPPRETPSREMPPRPAPLSHESARHEPVASEKIPQVVKGPAPATGAMSSPPMTGRPMSGSPISGPQIAGPQISGTPAPAPGPAPGAAAVAAPAPAAVKPPPLPPQPAPAMSASPREADVEMIQGLIKKLADEVNAAEAGLLRKPAGETRVPPAAIEASVNALRTTADQMRGPGPAALAGGSPAQLGGAAAPINGASAPINGAAAQSAAKAPARVPSATVPPSAVPIAVAPVAAKPAMPPPLPLQPSVTPPPSVASPPVAASRPPVAGIELADAMSPMPWPDDSDRPSADGARPRGEASGPAVAHARLAALAEAITAGRLDVLLDPILGLADQRARHFEVSVRLRDKAGQVLEPPDSVPELRDCGLLPLLDCARIQRSAQVASRLAARGKPGSLFSAFSGEALAHDQFLADFADQYAAREGLATQLVLSFAQADVRGFAGRDWETLEEMRELGFRFALQSVTDLDLDLEALKAAGFDFVKLDAAVFLDGMPASGGVIPASDICRHLAQLGMTLIVGHIDDDAQLARIFGFGVIYGQGQLFGGARPMKTEALADAGHAAA